MTPRPPRLAVLSIAVCVSAIFVGCSTTQTRISDHPEIYQRLGQTDQALVNRGEIRNGMPQEAVYLAWGNPEQRTTANVHGRPAETWVYTETTGDIRPFPHYGLGYGFGRGGFYGGGFGGGGGFYGGGFGGYRGGRSFNHGGRRFYGFGYDSFYDPFYFNRTEIVSYPSRTVSFQGGRVVAFQFLYPPRIF